MARAACQKSGAPCQGKNCFAVPPAASAMRVPCPAASMRAQGFAATDDVPELSDITYLVNKWESDDKPGSVMRLPAPDRHSSRGAVTCALKQPTRKAMVGPTTFPIWSCSKRGMPSMPRHRGIWWALTPPFHPYPAARRGGLLSVALSEGRPSWVLPSVLPCGARTFLPGPCGPQRRSVRLPLADLVLRRGLRNMPHRRKDCF